MADDASNGPTTMLDAAARAAISGDPLVVRVGRSMFALRRAEAACVRVALATCVALPLGGS